MKKGRMWILHIDAADGENVWFGVKMLAPIDDNASPGKVRRYETRRRFDGPVITRQRLLRLAPEAGNFTLGKPGVEVSLLGFQSLITIIRCTNRVFRRDLYAR